MQPLNATECLHITFKILNCFAASLSPYLVINIVKLISMYVSL